MSEFEIHPDPDEDVQIFAEPEEDVQVIADEEEAVVHVEDDAVPTPVPADDVEIPQDFNPLEFEPLASPPDLPWLVGKDPTTAEAIWVDPALYIGLATDHGGLGGLGDDDHPMYLRKKAYGGLGSQVPNHLHTDDESGGQILIPPAAPVAASYLTLGLHAGLSDERVLTGSASVVLTDLGVNDQLILSVNAAGVDHGGLAGLADDDHVQYVLRSVLTTNGDIPYRAAGVWSRLGVGSATQLLGVSAGLPAYVAQSYIDHGSVSGLSDDDHSLYALATHAFAVVGAVPARLTGGRQLAAGTGISLTDAGAGSTLTIASTLAGANPTASVGLAAVNGSATTFMRSDAAPALSQSITPTWTGLHIWDSASIRVKGYLALGTVTTAPTNTTNGDFTAIREFVSSSVIGPGGTGVTPVVELAVVAASVPRIHLQNNSSGFASTDGLQIATVGTTDAYFWHFENGQIHIATNNVERLNIAAGGEVTVNGALNVGTGIRIASAAASGQFIRGNGTTGVYSAIQVGDLPAHNLLSTTHGDTLAGTVVDGDIVIGNVTPKWSRLAISIPAANVRNVLGIDNGELRPSWKTALDGTAPTTVSLTASAAGTSLVFAHRDHGHDLSQSIVPTWTGSHTWSGASISMTGNSNFATSGTNSTGTAFLFYLAPAITGAGTIAGLVVNPDFQNTDATVYGMFLQATRTSNNNGTTLFASFHRASPQPPTGKTITEAISLGIDMITAGAGAVTTAYGMKLDPLVGSLVPTNVIGAHFGAQTLGTNNYDLSFGANDATALGAYVGRIPVLYGGLKRYIPVYA